MFGEASLYSNCKQLTPHNKPSALQRLDVGSVVLFGSALAGDFVVDTVVGEVVGTWEPAQFPYEVGDAFDACTVQPLLTCPPEIAGATFTLYRGATPAAPVHGMFSFVPCTTAGSADSRFARPAVAVTGVTNPANRQAPSGAKHIRPIADVADVWASVVDQVQSAGLGLGVDLAVPPQE